MKSHYHLILKKATVPISRSFYASFKKAFYEYMGGTI